jgi:hypothetical protein
MKKYEQNKLTLNSSLIGAKVLFLDDTTFGLYAVFDTFDSYVRFNAAALTE